MKSFKTWDDIQIAYQEWGDAQAPSAPVVLHHGFVADADSNWVAPGVVDALLAAGHRVIAPDARGHGRSEKPHDAARYGERVRRLVVGGVGSGVVECGGVDRRTVSTESIIEALSAEDPSTLEAPEAAAFRRLADAFGADREALVAQASSVYRGDIALDRIAAPTLVLAGDIDPLAVRPEVLARAIPGARLRIVSGNHIEAVADPGFTKSIVDFLA